MRVLLIYIVTFFAVHGGYGQAGFIKKAQKQLEKKEFEKVEEFIAKSFEKDSLYPAAFYMKSVLLFTTEYPDYQLDSAYKYILTTTKYYDSLDEKEVVKHGKLGVDLLNIDSVKRAVDASAFQRATSRDKEQDYIFFLAQFPTSIQVNMAIALRNERAFQSAVKVNTYQSYKTFMVKYPEATQLPEAEKRYEKLYFDKSTADTKLKSFEQFLVAHPTTRYRREAEQRIFEVYTADHSAQGYLKFINKYPKSFLRDKVVDFLFHSDETERKLDLIPEEFRSDSLEGASFKETDFIIPFLKNGKYGFINQSGKEIQSAIYEELTENQICGRLKQDFYVADGKLYGLNGQLINEGAFNTISDLGVGILKVEKNSKVGAWHKSGRVLFDFKYEDAKMVKGQFLALKKLGKWDLYTLTGINIANQGFDNIFSEGEFILFEKNGQYDIKKSSQLARVVNSNSINFNLIFEDYELLTDRSIWLQSSYGEVIYDADLNELLPYDEHEITFTDDRYTALNKKSIQVYDSAFNLIFNQTFDELNTNDQWIVYRKDTIWNLVNRNLLKVSRENVETFEFLGDHCVIISSEDQLEVFTQGEIIRKKADEGTFKLISAPQSSQYMLFTPKDKRDKISLYNTFGKKIIQSKLENVTSISDYGISFAQKGKKGLLSTSGEYLLRPKYDAIANMGDGMISILLNKKFGLYDVNNDLLIPARYERNIKKYNREFYVVVRDDRQLMIDRENNPISDDSFEEVMFWNDTSALVKNDFLWNIYDLKTGEVKEPGIKSLQFIKRTEEEQVAVVLVGNSYGLWSNVKGEIIAPTFNDIINVGTPEQPVYFTEKHIEEAEFYVVIYYNAEGKVIYKTAVEAEDYPMIYCDN